MDNSSDVGSFVLGTYGDSGSLKYLYFTLAAILYVSVICANTLLIVVIYLEERLHEPMYQLLCALFVNEVYGSTALLPCLMAHILADTHHISLFFCLLQIFNIQTYVDVEFRTLSVMAFDRYASICRPLHYNSIMTKGKVRVIVLVVWAASFVQTGVLLSFIVRLRFCGSVINKVSCGYNLVVGLSCSANSILPFLNDVVSGLILGVAAPLCFITFTYVRIFSVCLKASSETRVKAFETCSPHLVSIMSFVFSCFYNLISPRFNMTFVPLQLRIILSIYAFLIQPILNPLIYGLKLTKIRHALKKL
ncbi:olfactory receptor 2F1-like [Betta splendens]|uniref:Olfactory receptor n=1 Tax=Betta splendens TaxID=158456 RepID=A0A6P7LD15_BETSP|nr:olfactory receptor 2F1-like [Betta splendens]